VAGCCEHGNEPLRSIKGSKFPDARFEAFMAVKIRVEFFCIVTLCSVVVGYQRFRGPGCLHLQEDGGSMDL
jgi:hypothetical protein